MVDNNQNLMSIIRPIPQTRYCISVAIASVQRTIDGWIESQLKVNLNPDFQRGHVWTQDKQIAYLENLIRGIAPNKILFNCAQFLQYSSPSSDLDPDELVCVDGLQRITAALAFMNNEFRLFGDKLTKADLDHSHYSTKRVYFEFQMFEITRRRDLLQFYLDLNSGGVVHSESEIQKVKQLIAEI